MRNPIMQYADRGGSRAGLWGGGVNCLFHVKSFLTPLFSGHSKKAKKLTFSFNTEIQYMSWP